MAEIRLRGLVLRETDFGDCDRYLSLLTEDGRRTEILHRNAKRSRKHAASAQQFCFSEFIVSERGGRYSFRDASLIHSFFPLSQDIERYALACYLAELTGALADEQTDCPALCSVLLTALSALEKKKRDPALVKAALEWRVMAEGGYAPDLAECSVCGEPLVRPPIFFSVEAGGAADEKCARRVGGFTPLDNSAAAALRHALTADPRRLFAFTLTGPAKEQFTTLAERFAAYHLGRGFASLKLYDSLKIEPKKSSKKGAERRVESEEAAVPLCTRINR